jgi:hypothetical protein
MLEVFMQNQLGKKMARNIYRFNAMFQKDDRKNQTLKRAHATYLQPQMLKKASFHAKSIGKENGKKHLQI